MDSHGAAEIVGSAIRYLFVVGLLVGIALASIIFLGVGGCHYIMTPNPEEQQLRKSAQEKLTPEEWSAIQ